MIAKGSKVRFTMPQEVYEMMKPYNPTLQQVVEGVTVSDEYYLNGRLVVDVQIGNTATTLEAETLEVIDV